jgi:hypothetical protein
VLQEEEKEEEEEETHTDQQKTQIVRGGRGRRWSPSISVTRDLVSVSKET